LKDKESKLVGQESGITRRCFVKSIFGSCTCMLLTPNYAFSNDNSHPDVKTLLLTEGKFKVNHSWTDSKATLGIAGYGDKLKVLHLSDTHITCSDESDIPFQQYSKRMDSAYATTIHYETKKTTTPLENFRNSMHLAQKEKVDMIILTGDIVNNPSKTSVTAVSNELKKTGIPYIYIAGNHDWHYEGMEGSANELREYWRKKQLYPLYKSKSLSHFAVVKNGINFIAIDNSTYQVDEQQLEFYKKQIASGRPAVLLMHIPFSLTSLPSMLCGHPEWGAKTDRGYKIERRQKRPENGNLKSTMDFVKTVSSSNNLIAVLCGHKHKPRADMVNPLAFKEITSPSAIQYIASAGAVGGYRIVCFEEIKPKK
jgi:3',5'-cyclic AMP phosphodiesterase CpdA